MKYIPNFSLLKITNTVCFFVIVTKPLMNLKLSNKNNKLMSIYEAFCVFFLSYQTKLAISLNTFINSYIFFKKSKSKSYSFFYFETKKNIKFFSLYKSMGDSNSKSIETLPSEGQPS